MPNLKFVASTVPKIWRWSQNLQDAQLPQRDCAAGCIIVLAKSE